MSEKLAKTAAMWLASGAGLPLVVRENEKSFFAYTADKDIVTKNAENLDAPHALVLIGGVKDYPKLDVPMFVFGYEDGMPNLTEQEEEEAVIVDAFAHNPAEAVKNACEYLRMEFGTPARGERPKFLVVAEFPLLAAIALGTLTWIDFYFKSFQFLPVSEKDIDRVVSAFVYAVTWSRKGEGLSLSIQQLLDRPSVKAMVPFLKEHCSYLTPEIIKKAGLTKVLLAQEIEDRRASLN